jgi:hypothetical protein
MTHSPEKGDSTPFRGVTSRRTVLGAGLGLAAASLMNVGSAFAQTAGAGEQNRDAAIPKTEKSMDSRKLGNLEVSAIGLGCLPLVGCYGNAPRDRKSSVALIRAAFEQYQPFGNFTSTYRQG